MTGELNVKLVNNALAFLFEEIRYELAGVEVDRTKNIGITSTIKTLLSINEHNVKSLQNAGWIAPTNNVLNVGNEFNFCLPLKILLGFAEDYTRIVMNVKQERILLRTATDINAMVSETATEPNGVLELTKVSWKMPYVHVANMYRLPLLRLVEADRPLTMAFRSWELQDTSPCVTADEQTDLDSEDNVTIGETTFCYIDLSDYKKDDLKKHAAEFDHCKVTNAKLFLNDKYYPYDNCNPTFRCV